MKKANGLLVLTVIASAAIGGVLSGEEHPGEATRTGGGESVREAAEHPIGVAEARGRARLLYETIHATLHVVHHQYCHVPNRKDTKARTAGLVIGIPVKQD